MSDEKSVRSALKRPKEHLSMLIRRGTYKGFNWFIALNFGGLKCAYVAVSPEDIVKMFNVSAQQLTDEDVCSKVLSMPGGCTYVQSFLHSDDGDIETGSCVLGWDYAHFADVVGNFPYCVSKVSDDKIESEIEVVINELLRLRSQASTEVLIAPHDIFKE